MIRIYLLTILMPPACPQKILLWQMPLYNIKYPSIVEKSKENINATLNQFWLNRFSDLETLLQI